MNERIKLLAEQANFYLPKGLPSEWSDEDYIASPSQIEKFVELIVQECLVACSRANEIRHFVQPLQQQVVLDCMLEIEKHFGVEE